MSSFEFVSVGAALDNDHLLDDEYCVSHRRHILDDVHISELHFD